MFNVFIINELRINDIVWIRYIRNHMNSSTLNGLAIDKSPPLSSIVVILSFQALVWDDALTGPFGLIAEYSLLKVM